MTIIKKFAFRVGKNYMLNQLKSKTFKTHIIASINQKIDIPKLNEKQEEDLFKAIYNAIVIYLAKK